MTKLFVTPSLFNFKRNCSGRWSFACNADTIYDNDIADDEGTAYDDDTAYGDDVACDDTIIYDNDIIGGADAAIQITLGDSDSSDNSFEYNDQDWKPVGDKVRISLKD